MIAAVIAAGLAFAPPAASPRPAPAVRRYAGLVVSPDGSRFAAVESAGDPGGTAGGPLTIRRTADGARVVTADPCAKRCTVGSPTWSPDGTRIAYLARDEKARTVALGVVDAAGTHARTLATIAGEAETPRWSPDGRRLAILAVAGAHKAVGATQAGTPLVGDIGAVVAADEQRLDVIDLATGAAHFASPADTWVYEYDWTPDGRAFVATAAKGNGDANWWIAHLAAFDAASGAERIVASPAMQMNAPRVSPDGATVAFIGGLMSDFGSVGGDVYTVPLAGGTPVDVTPGYEGSFTSLTWHGAGPGLTATALAGDRAAVVAIDPAAKTARVVWSDAVSIGAGGESRVAFSRDGRIAATVAEDFEHAPHVIAGLPAAMSPVTHDNDALPAAVHARSVSWTSDGFRVQGWLLEPLHAPAGRKAAMVTEIHGGPSAAATPRFLTRGTERDLLERGYFVFLPNPRGSYGQGERFTEANRRDFGGGDLRDILAGIDAVEKVAPVDDARLGVFGHSYGGFMTMWTVTQTKRFKAAVAGAGIANWISYYGENGIDTWMPPFFGGTAYEDPAIYRKLSPIEYIKNAATPTFVYVGERDVECPAPQSLEFWRGLRAYHVPSDLMVYAGEGHAIRQPANRRDLARRIAGWFATYL